MENSLKNEELPSAPFRFPFFSLISLFSLLFISSPLFLFCSVFVKIKMKGSRQVSGLYKGNWANLMGWHRCLVEASMPPAEFSLFWGWGHRSLQLGSMPPCICCTFGHQQPHGIDALLCASIPSKPFGLLEPAWHRFSLVESMPSFTLVSRLQYCIHRMQF